MRSRPEISAVYTEKSGSVRRMTHEIESSSTMRPNMARPNAIRRARAFWCSGSLPERMEIKTMLSMHSTISRTGRGPSAIHACGPEIHSTVATRLSVRRESEENILRRQSKNLARRKQNGGGRKGEGEKGERVAKSTVAA